jgi:hypothetical protein
MNLVEFVTDPQLLNLSISPAQETLLRAIDGLPLVNDEQWELWELCTGRKREDYLEGHRYPEVTVICGARSGKDSRIAVPAMLYEATRGGHEQYLGRGERGIMPIVAQDQRATAVAFNYCREYLAHSDLLSGMVADVSKNEIELANGITLMTFPSTAASLRAWSVAAGCLDELAFFDANDHEIQMSMIRGGINFPNPRIFKISTPFAKAGLLYDDFQSSFGKPDDHRLVWRASTFVMNPSIKAARFARYATEDPLRYAREFEAVWQDALSVLLAAEWIERAIAPGVFERAPQDSLNYILTGDVSGGGRDAFTCCIAHREADRIVQDVIRGWQRPPDLAGVFVEIADIAKRYRCSIFHGDKYAAGWSRQAAQKAGLTYQEVPFDKSRAYVETEPLFAQGRIEILDHAAQARELKLLEKRALAGGITRVDAPRGISEDHANALALAAALLVRQQGHGAGLRVRALDVELSKGNDVRSQFHRSSLAAVTAAMNRNPFK